MEEGRVINMVERQIKEFVEQIRPPENERDELDYGYKFEKNTLEMFEIRPVWDNLDKKMESETVKFNLGT